MSWGIAETAPEIEKIKAKSGAYLDELNACGDLEYSTYSDLWDFYYDLLGKAYEQGMKDAQTAEAIPIDFIKKYMDWEKMEWDESHKYVVDRYRLSDTIQFLLDRWKEEQEERKEE